MRLRKLLGGRLGKRASSPQNILVVTEHFIGGGLETQICTQAEYLAGRGIAVHLATSSPPSKLASDTFASTLFDLPLQTTGQGVLDTISRIEQHALRQSIDVVHAHPFLSFVVGMAVAQRLHLPLVATLHGPSSVSLTTDTIYDILFRKALLPKASLLLAVSEEVRFLASAITRCSPLVLPNAVAVPSAPQRLPAKELPWMWAGRIDSDKLVGLKCLIAEVLRLKKCVLHIYGDGPAIGDLQAHLTEVDPQADWVLRKGWESDLFNCFPVYSVVAGMGRVLLEAAAASRPTLLVGYDGVKGLLTEAQFGRATDWNLSGRGLPTISSQELDAQLGALAQSPQQFIHYKWMRENRPLEVIWRKYDEYIRGLNPFSSGVVEKFLDCLKYSGSMNVPVWGDWRIYILLNSLTRMRDEKQR